MLVPFREVDKPLEGPVGVEGSPSGLSLAVYNPALHPDPPLLPGLPRWEPPPASHSDLRSHPPLQAPCLPHYVPSGEEPTLTSPPSVRIAFWQVFGYSNNPISKTYILKVKLH